MPPEPSAFHASGAETQGDALVIDASAAVHAAMVEDGFLVFDGAAIHAPTLLWSEAAAALNQLVWRGDLSDDEADAALQRLLSAPIESHPSADLVTAATRIARRLGWAKTYDAEYLSLSRRLGAPFVTADARLSRAARSVVRVLDPSDLG